MNRLNLTGYKFGRLTVVSESASIKGQTMWKCLCDCGNHVIVQTSKLTTGHTKSCGCLCKENTLKKVKKYCNYDLSGEFGIGYTTNTNSQFYFDLEDYELIKDIAWNLNDQGYMLGGIVGNSKKLIRMHRLIMCVNSNVIIDHKNQIRYDNRKSNLRISNKQLNGINRGVNKNNKLKTKGVYEQNGKYVASITVNKEKNIIGYYSNLTDASNAYKDKCIEIFGEYAPFQCNKDGGVALS